MLRMEREELEYRNLGGSLPDVVHSYMFGKPCLKIAGKAFACFFENAMVFKLSGDRQKAALDLTGSKLFDPSGKGRAMKEWVQVSGVHSACWPDLAKWALSYVKD